MIVGRLASSLGVCGLLGCQIIVFQDMGMASDLTRALTDPSCPADHPDRDHSWVDYMSGVYRSTAPKVSGVAMIEFRYAKQVNDRAALPGIDPSQCYAVKWNSHNPKFPDGYSSINVTTPENWHNGLPGDPRKFEVNVHGTLLKFRPSGEVLNLKGVVVGTFVCYVDWDTCKKYGY